MVRSMSTPVELLVPEPDRGLLVRGEHHDPHAILGAHPAGGGTRVVAFHPEAISAELLTGPGQAIRMDSLGQGLWMGTARGLAAGASYRLRFTFADGADWERDDPYRFLPTLGELDLHLISEGTHERLWEVLGAHPREHQGVAGVAFAVWAPNARSVRVVGDFDRWDGRLLPDALARRIGRVGAVRAGHRSGRALQVRGAGRGREAADQGRPALLLPAGTAGDRIARVGHRLRRRLDR